ncbi:MAG: polysaccharide-degrading enzyme, partial [Phycisphaerae bacterium]
MALSSRCALRFKSVCAFGSFWFALIAVPETVQATIFDVGTGQPYPTVGAVPWETLQAGDRVRIHWRPEPYHEKFVINGIGAAGPSIVVQGILGPEGQRPVIDGENATTRPQLNYWNQDRSVIKVGGSSTPNVDIARWILIENLDIRGARPSASFTSTAGIVQSYRSNAAAVHVERGEFVAIRNCIIRDSANGIFVSSSEDYIARDIFIERNYIHSNGLPGNIFVHNTYTAGLRVTYEGNRFGPLAPGAGGNNLKDRSAGLIVRYNWIEGGNRQLDLVDAEDSGTLQNDPAYRTTHVYGNVLIEPDDAGNRQIIHYGGDSGNETGYRKGTLHLYFNTIVSTRVGRTTFMRLSTDEEHCDARNNIVFVTDNGNQLSMLDDAGTLSLRNNWLKPGWV